MSLMLGGLGVMLGDQTYTNVQLHTYEAGGIGSRPDRRDIFERDHSSNGNLPKVAFAGRNIFFENKASKNGAKNFVVMVIVLIVCI